MALAISGSKPSGSRAMRGTAPENAALATVSGAMPSAFASCRPLDRVLP